MKISRDWLSDFIEWKEKDPQVIADQLTRRMGEVDEVTMQGQFLEKCIVGKVLTIEKHPNADKLTVCTVETEQGVKTVVCGGTNLKKDMLVAFAHVGATVKWHGTEVATLAPVKIRGVESHGMICASEELEIESLFPARKDQGERAIADLSESGLKVGASLKKALGLDDVVWHIDNHAITNRPDLFSHIGVARELVAMGLATWKKESKKPAVKFGKSNAPFELKNEAKNLVPYYYGTMMEIDGAGESPDWMRKRLAATGWRSINLVVDITNYVLMEVGMPLHAFDVDDFKGTLHIRTTKKGESLTTLDDVKRTLPEGAVVINDDAGIFDIFGVMGGLRTSTKSTTKRIWLQAGVIEPSSVRKTILATAHRTDASTVYEKGVAMSTAETGLMRAIELFSELHPKSAVTSKLMTWGKETSKKSVKIESSVLESYIGMPIKSAQSKKILSDLGFSVKGGDTMTVTPPKWRNDIATRQDIVEEVARIFGYANITPAIPAASIALPHRDPRTNMLRDALKEESYIEFLHLAFASPELLRKCGLDPKDAPAIENPLGEELSLMRTSLLPSMLETVARELPRVDMRLKAFEVGKKFGKKDEVNSLVMIVAAKHATTLQDDPTLILKADILQALKALGHPSALKLSKDVSVPYAHPGRFGEILFKGKKIGYVTEVHPNIRANFGLQNRVAMCLLDLESLLKETPETNIATALPVYPPVEFDETLPLPASHEGLIAKAMKSDPLLVNIEVLHLYQKAAEKNITLRFTYRSAERTLTQDEAKKAHIKVLQALGK